jgi:hypothetical protein
MTMGIFLLTTQVLLLQTDKVAMPLESLFYLFVAVFAKFLVHIPLPANAQGSDVMDAASNGSR